MAERTIQFNTIVLYVLVYVQKLCGICIENRVGSLLSVNKTPLKWQLPFKWASLGLSVMEYLALPAEGLEKLLLEKPRHGHLLLSDSLHTTAEDMGLPFLLVRL